MLTVQVINYFGFFVSVPLTMVCASTATKTEVDQQIFQISMVGFDFLFYLFKIQKYIIYLNRAFKMPYSLQIVPQFYLGFEIECNKTFACALSGINIVFSSKIIQ